MTGRPETVAREHGGAPGREPPGWLTSPRECGRAAGFGVYVNLAPLARGGGPAGPCPDPPGPADAPGPDAYLAAVLADLERTATVGRASLAPPASGVSGGWPAVTSVFVGAAPSPGAGGRPGPGSPAPRAPADGDPGASRLRPGGCLPAGAVQEVLARLRACLPVAGDVEVTVEVAPEHLTAEGCRTLVGAGVTRLSLPVDPTAPGGSAGGGAPRLSPAGEAAEGGPPPRPPDPPAAVARAVATARWAGISRVNLDLAPDPAERWVAGAAVPRRAAGASETTLRRALACGVEHVTLVERGPRGEGGAAGVLAAAGFHRYELGSWAASPAARSRHALLYWRHGDYLAFGAHAHGHLRGRRWWVPAADGYVAAVGAGRPPVAGAEVVPVAGRAIERLLLGLRLAEGLAPADTPPLDERAATALRSAGLIRGGGRASGGGGRLRATPRGWLLLDEVVVRLVGEPGAFGARQDPLRPSRAARAGGATIPRGRR